MKRLIGWGPAAGALVMIALALLNHACRSADTPETIALEFIRQVESAVDERSIRALSELVAAGYRDPGNRDRRDIVGLASAYLFRSGSLYLFTDLRTAQLSAGERIQCSILAAFAAVPVDRKNLLSGVEADFYWFDIELIEEQGKWKVVSAIWEQAMLDDFLGGGRSGISKAFPAGSQLFVIRFFAG